jgi:hypothetical protein
MHACMHDTHARVKDVIERGPGHTRTHTLGRVKSGGTTAALLLALCPGLALLGSGFRALRGAPCGNKVWRSVRRHGLTLALGWDGLGVSQAWCLGEEWGEGFEAVAWGFRWVLSSVWLGVGISGCC